MQQVENSQQLTESIRATAEGFSSFSHGPKKGDVVFFRMETPSQLEKEYEFGPVLGEGTFGVVYRGIRKKDNAKCAIKKILRERTFSVSERARLDREISILRLVRHPGIIQLMAVAESPTILFLITELCEGNTLSNCLEALPPNTGLQEYVVVEIVRQVTSALSYLHNRGIIHRDLKAGNIMLLHKVDLDYRKILTEPLSTKNSCEADGTPQNVQTPRAPTVPVITEAQITACGIAVPRSAGRATTRLRNAKGAARASAMCFAVGQQVVDNKARKPHSSPYALLKSAGGLSREAAAQLSHPKSPPALLVTKLIDFGLAIEVRKNEETLGSPCGTPLYMAPEVLSGRSYTRQCDVWSLGILMYQLLTRELPFVAQTEEQLIEQISKFDISKVLRTASTISPLAQNCLLHTLRTDPAYRYSASELLLDPWVSYGTSTNQEENIAAEPNETVNFSIDLFDDAAGRLSSSMIPTDSSLTRIRNSLTLRPPSVAVAQLGSTHSTTNVLELMKQYHKELTGVKQDETDDNVRNKDHSQQ